jgi:hypothetical protein
MAVTKNRNIENTAIATINNCEKRAWHLAAAALRGGSTSWLSDLLAATTDHEFDTLRALEKVP